jgi:large subunit ribosomal protein L23
MNAERLAKILLAPHVSEKSSRVADAHRQVVFKVVPSARKLEIKKAVERMFEVEVERVCVTNIKGKRKAFGRVPGQRSNWKKAYVTLKEGHDIDFMSGD